MRNTFLGFIMIMQWTAGSSQVPMDSVKIAGSYYAAIGRTDLTGIFGYAPEEKKMTGSFDMLGGGYHYACTEVFNFRKDGVMIYANCDREEKLQSIQLYKRSRFFVSDLGLRIKDRITLEKLGTDEKAYAVEENSSLLYSGVRRLGKIKIGSYTIYTNPVPLHQLTKNTSLRVKYIELILP